MSVTCDTGTITLCKGRNCALRAESREQRLKKCSALNLIQHVDIYGRYKLNYFEVNRMRIRSNNNPICVSSIASRIRRITGEPTSFESSVKNVDSKLSRFSSSTRSGLFPNSGSM